MVCSIYIYVMNMYVVVVDVIINIRVFRVCSIYL